MWLTLEKVIATKGAEVVRQSVEAQYQAGKFTDEERAIAMGNIAEVEAVLKLRARIEMIEVLTCTVTAFGSWADFRKALRGGYVPTFRKDGKESEHLGLLVEYEGFNVFWID